MIVDTFKNNFFGALSDSASGFHMSCGWDEISRTSNGKDITLTKSVFKTPQAYKPESLATIVDDF